MIQSQAGRQSDGYGGYWIVLGVETGREKWRRRWIGFAKEQGVFVLGLLKMGGPRCVTYFWGPRMCDKV